MEVYVKETLHVLDYDNNIKDTIFISDDHRTAGYAYNINITEANTGYSDLTFDMPNTIIDENGNQLKNPKLALLTPLVKLRYNRTVYYMGEKEITVREPIGYGDKVEYQDVTYSNTYPNNIIEDYVMDYIVQPVDKKRDSLTIVTSFTAMDYPRFSLSKKRVGLSISEDTLTKEEWSLYKNEPMSIPGKIKYISWNPDLEKSARGSDEHSPSIWDEENKIYTWNPKTAKEYPLSREHILKFMEDKEVAKQWEYGLLATAFWWKIEDTARFEGVHYKKDSYLIFKLYDFLQMVDADEVDQQLQLGRYSWEWTQLYKVDSYLTPNRADNYLHHILEGTNWSVKQRINSEGKLEDDVDIVQVEIPTPAGSTEATVLADSTCNISVNGSNCYNAITSVCQGLQLYPIFDCINREVSLKAFAGKNYGLTYHLGRNIANDSIKKDGEKIITKLYVTGGKDYQGDQSINIGTATRAYTQLFEGFYKTIDELPVFAYDSTGNAIQEVKGKWAIVDNQLTEQYWSSGSNRKIYQFIKDNNNWIEVLPNEDEEYVVDGYTIDIETGLTTPWNPNDEAYIFARSPYGTNYILNFKWMYDNKWITKYEILELYQLQEQLHHLNYDFMDKYTKDRVLTQQEYNAAINDSDIHQDGYISTLHTMANQYYYDDTKASLGKFHAFHRAPAGTYTGADDKHYVKLCHCNGIKNGQWCGYTAPQNFTTCPSCSGTDISEHEIYIPVYEDFSEEVNYTGVSIYPFVPGKEDSAEYNPHITGSFQRLVETLDQNNDIWTREDYEKAISIIEPIDIETADGDGTFDNREYVIYGPDNEKVYVKSVSGKIETWNENINTYITNYGLLLVDYKKIDECNKKIEELQYLYDQWADNVDDINYQIQEKFGDYIIEGNYTNNEQPYDNLLFREGLEASDKFAIPEVTYNLDVIDSSGLIEYREPWVFKHLCQSCGYITNHHIELCPKCNTEMQHYDKDVYNDLVYSLHSVGQIMPKAGDYVTIYDEPMGMYGVPGLITEITRVLDHPVENEIQIDTSYTDDEELVGNIITATNTVLNNSDIYARTAVLKADGTIDATSLQESLDNASANVSIIGTEGNMILNGSGLKLTDPSNPNRAMKYTGKGVYSTTTLQADGSVGVWQEVLTPDGINANAINAGTIDTRNVNISSGLYSKITLDQNGLAIKSDTKKGYTIGAITDLENMSSWGSDNNLKLFVGVDKNNEALAYVDGYLIAKEGSNIAGWITDKNSLYHKSGDTKDLWLSPNGINGTVNGEANTYTLYANGNFGVATNGILYAKDAVIQGDITSDNVNITGGSLTIGSNFSVGNDGTLTAKAGKIAGYTMSGNQLIGVNVGLSGKSGEGWAFWAGSNTAGSAPFRVGHSGELIATNATITGSITATSGSFSGTITTTNLTASGTVTINDAQIKTATLTSCKISAGQITSGTFDSARIPNLDASKITSGTIDASRISSGTFTSTSGSYTGQLTAGGLKAANGNDSIFISGNIISIKNSSGTVTGIGPGYMTNTTGSLRIRNQFDYNGNDTDGSIYIASGKSITLRANDGYVYAGSVKYDTNNARIAVDSAGPSSRILKTDITDFTSEQYSSALELLDEIKLYNYHYKYRIHDKVDQFGFMIDDLLDNSKADRFFHFKDETAGITPTGGLDYAVIDEGRTDLELIDFKRYDEETLIKYLLVCCKALQMEIKALKKEESV